MQIFVFEKSGFMRDKFHAVNHIDITEIAANVKNYIAGIVKCPGIGYPVGICPPNRGDKIKDRVRIKGGDFFQKSRSIGFQI